MLKIPYIKQPDSMSCALSCYSMVAQYFFPQVTFEEIAKISDWQKGYVVWAFKFWKWIMDRGIKIQEYDLLDYRLWAEQGIDGLISSVSEKEFSFYVTNTKDIGSYSADIQKVIQHSNFQLNNEKPSFELLEEAVAGSKLCEVVLDSRALRNKNGFSLHRVVILDVTNDSVVFHDPAGDPNEVVSKDKFVSSWLKAVAEPELCIYER